MSALIPRLPLVASAVVLSLLTASCGGEQADDVPAIDLPEDPDEIVLDVSEEGGFVPAEMMVGRVPRFVLTAGGVLYYQGPVPAIYPGPLLPNIQGTRLDEATLEEILRLVAEIGLPETERVSNTDAASTVADATTTVVTYFDEEGAHVYEVYALGFLEQQTDARVALLQELVNTLDRAAVAGEPEGEYVPERLEVNAIVRDVPPEPEFQNVRPWPLPSGFDEMEERAAGFRCAVFEGEQADELLATFRDANQATTWELDGQEYTLVPRPLFPHEEGCVTGA